MKLCLYNFRSRCTESRVTAAKGGWQSVTLVVLEAGQEALIVVVVPAVPLPDTRAGQVASVHDVVETNTQETV